MPTGDLWIRQWHVVAGALDTGLLRVRFKITRSDKPQPNKAELSIWNMTPGSRASLEIFGDQIPISIEAGYAVAGVSVLFVGEVRTMRHEREGTDVITTIGAGDGEAAFRKARVSKSFAKGAKVDEILKALVSALGVSPGNSSSAIVKLKLAGIGALFSSGTVIHGSASREMTALCRSCGLSWSIQNGALQLLPLGQALAGQAIVLNQATGLEGSPSIDSKGIMRGRCRMVRDLFPGRIVQIESEFLSGNFKLTDTEAVGDSHADEWGYSFEGKAF